MKALCIQSIIPFQVGNLYRCTKFLTPLGTAEAWSVWNIRQPNTKVGGLYRFIIEEYTDGGYNYIMSVNTFNQYFRRFI